MLLTLLASQDMIEDPSLRRLRERCKKLAPFKRKEERWVLERGDIDRSNIANLKRFCLAESLIALKKGLKLEGELTSDGGGSRRLELRRVILRCYENSWKVWEDLVNDNVFAETDGEGLIIALYFASRYLLKLRAENLARLYIKSMTALLRSVTPQGVCDKIIRTLLHISNRDVPHDNRTLEDDLGLTASDNERTMSRFNGLNFLQKKALAQFGTSPADQVIDSWPPKKTPPTNHHDDSASYWILEEVARILKMNSLDQCNKHERLNPDGDTLVLSEAIWKKLRFVHKTQIPVLQMEDIESTEIGSDRSKRVRELMSCLLVTKFLGKASAAQPLGKILTALHQLIKSGISKSNPADRKRLIIDKFDLERRLQALKNSTELFRGRSESPFINSVKAIIANAEAATIAIILLAEGRSARAYSTAKLPCERCVPDIHATDWEREFGNLFDPQAQQILSAAMSALSAQVNRLNEVAHFEKLRALALLSTVLESRRCSDSNGSVVVPSVTALSHTVTRPEPGPSSYQALEEVLREPGDQRSSSASRSKTELSDRGLQQTVRDSTAEVSEGGLHRTIRETLEQMMYKRVRCKVPPFTLDLMPLRKEIDRIYWCHQTSCEEKGASRKAPCTTAGVAPKHDLLQESDRREHYWWRPS